MIPTCDINQHQLTSPRKPDLSARSTVWTPQINAASLSSSSAENEAGGGGEETTTEPETVLSRFIYLWTFETFFFFALLRFFIISMKFRDFFRLPHSSLFCCFLRCFSFSRNLFRFIHRKTLENAVLEHFFLCTALIRRMQHQLSRIARGTQCECLMRRSFLSGFYKSI